MLPVLGDPPTPTLNLADEEFVRISENADGDPQYRGRSDPDSRRLWNDGS